MLLGGYGPGAQRVLGARGGIDRGELVLTWDVKDPPDIATFDEQVCVLAGAIRSAPWHTDVCRTPGSASAAGLLHAWRQLQDSIMDGLRGNFVLLLWDEKRRDGLIARDPTGLSPLVYSFASDCLLFASELRQLLPVMSGTPEPDIVAMSFWLSGDGCWDQRTMFEGIRPLRAAHLLELGDGRARERAWWRPRYTPPEDLGIEEAAARVACAIGDSIASCTTPDERIALLLSGGLDSSSVAALAQRELRGSQSRLTTYSAIFPDLPKTDERDLIEEVAAHLTLPSVQMAVHGGSPLKGALEFIQQWSVPSVTANGFFSDRLIQQIQNDDNRLVLGGEGGDELFALSPSLLTDRLRAGRLGGAMQLAASMPGANHQSRRSLVWLCLTNGATATLPSSFLARIRRPHNEWIDEPDWLSPELLQTHREHVDPPAWRKLAGPRWWAYLAHDLTRGRELMGVSDHLRRLYERDGLRMHQPLLDLAVVECVLSLSPQLAYSAHHNRPVLRTALKDMIPERVRTRTSKVDFLPVVLQGLIQSDLEVARSLLLASDARVNQFVSPEIIREQLLEGPPERHPRGLGAWARELWQLLCAECWLRAQGDPDFIPTLLSRLRPTPTSFHLAPRGRRP